VEAEGPWPVILEKILLLYGVLELVHDPSDQIIFCHYERLGLQSRPGETTANTQPERGCWRKDVPTCRKFQAQRVLLHGESDRECIAMQSAGCTAVKMPPLFGSLPEW
jgi:hypothetical protein